MISLKHYIRIGIVAFLMLVPRLTTGQPLETSTWVHHERQAPTRAITALITLPDDHIAAVTDSSLHVFDGVRWKKHPVPDILPEYAEFFFADNTGMLYYYKSEVIYQWNATSPEDPVETIATGMNLWPLIGSDATGGSVYFGSGNATNGGIYLLTDGSLTLLRAGQTRSFTISADGDIWAIRRESVGSEYRLWVGADTIWEDLTDELGGITDITRVFAAPDSSIWINREADYTVYHDGTWEHFSGGAQEPRYLAFDTHGDVWGMTSSGSRVFRRDADGNWRTQWSSSTVKTSTRFFATGPDGRRFIADDDMLLEYTEYDNWEQRSYAELWDETENPYDLGSDRVTCMAYTSDGYLICGHGDDPFTPQDEQEDSGISIFDGESWLNFKQASNGPANFLLDNVYALTAMRSGDVLVSSNYEFNMLFDGTSWSYIDSLYTVENPLNTQYANDYLQSSIEELWVATTSGLLYFDYWGFADLLYDPFFTGGTQSERDAHYNYHNLYEDSAGIIYFQNAEGSIFSYDPGITSDHWDFHSGQSAITRDYIVIGSGESMTIWSAYQDGITRLLDVGNEPVNDAATGDAIILPAASLITLDDDDNIWASGYGNTGYIDDDGFWHRMEALDTMQATTHAFDGVSLMAFNAARITPGGETDAIEYMGVYTYDYDKQTAVEDTPVSFELAVNYPNPFNAATTISFTLAESGRTTVHIYSLTGQRIRTLDDRVYTSGTHHIRWDGRDDTGRDSGSGIYLFRITAPRTNLTGRMVLIR